MTVVLDNGLDNGGDLVVHLDDAAPLEGLSRLRSGVRAHLLAGGRTVVVDITGVTRLSSGTVAALLWARRHCRSRGGRVVVRGPSPESLAMLTRSGLADVFAIERTAPLPGRGS